MRTVSALAPPKQLGKYEVGAKIGGGGMATVYIGRAEREDGTEERVALKVIRDELANDERFKSMFIDEAKILAQLSHPNVIRTLEYGVTGHHRFIAMELLSGRTYSDVWDVLADEGRPHAGRGSPPGSARASPRGCTRPTSSSTRPGSRSASSIATSTRATSSSPTAAR